MIIGFEHFVPHSYASNPGLRQVGLNSLLNPVSSFDRNGHVGKILVTESDNEIDICMGEGNKNVRISVVEFHSADIEGFEKIGDSRWRWKIVCDLAIVDSNSKTKDLDWRT